MVWQQAIRCQSPRPRFPWQARWLPRLLPPTCALTPLHPLCTLPTPTRPPPPANVQPLLAVLRAERGPATNLALRAVANLAAHNSLHAALASAGAAIAIVPFLQPGAAGAVLQGGEAFELALLAVSRLSGQPETQAALASGQGQGLKAAIDVVAQAPGPASAPLDASAAAGAGAHVALGLALETLMGACSRDQQAVLALQGHLPLMQRLMAAMAATQVSAALAG